jgi:flagellar protein FliS
MNAVASTYRKMELAAEVSEATPKDLIQLLFDGANGKLQRARVCIAHHDIAGRSSALSSASEIIDGLRNSLDLAQGGDLAANLNELYGYMINRLFRANADNDDAAVTEVMSLLATISEAWSALDAEVAAPPAKNS